MTREEQIRRRVDAATPGPWESEGMDSGHSRYEMNRWIVAGDYGDTICDMDGLTRSDNEKLATDDGGADAWFIAHAREDVPYLLDRIAELESQITEAQARAWDKGYGKGREDGSSWFNRIGGVRGKPSRNPYRHKKEKTNGSSEAG